MEMNPNDQPTMISEKRTLTYGDPLRIGHRCVGETDRIEIYRYKEEANYHEGSAELHPLIARSISGNGTAVFDTASLPEPGYYWIFHTDSEGSDVYESFEILLTDAADVPEEGAAGAEITLREENGVTVTTLNVRAKTEQALHYRFYWYGNGQRLEDHTPIWEGDRAGDFAVTLHPSIFMPDGADSVEIAVGARTKNSLIVPAPAALRPPKGDPLCRFAVFTDLHMQKNHIRTALRRTRKLAPDSNGIFTCGDQTNSGTAEEYEILKSIFDPEREFLPPLFFGIGNHDFGDGTDYDLQARLFTENLRVPALHYHVDLCGYRFILLGSDVAGNGYGVLGEEQLDWLEKRLSEADPTKPTFLFLHQPLIETVSGTLYSMDPKIQFWFGVKDAAERLHAIFAKYPNTVLFTGHTHWKFDSIGPIKFCGDSDATFVNCSAVGYLWNDQDHAEPGSEGYFVEVYGDHVRLRGRELVRDQWSADAQYIIPFVGKV